MHYGEKKIFKVEICMKAGQNAIMIQIATHVFSSSEEADFSHPQEHLD